jgi:pimeloyl-ACP methyl ester carboxylesterase
MTAFRACLLLIGLFATPGRAEFPGERSEWNGYARYDFQIAGRTAHVVAPHTAAPGKPWIWRARFWGHEPQTDLALLERGFHVAYCDVANLFGSPSAVKIWNAFYREMTTTHGFAPQVVLEGLSRGGLIIYNWAKANPTKVACIYADAPVCDIKSWPRDHSSAATWAQCLAVYGLTNEQAAVFTGNPIDGLEPLAKAKVPLLHIVGDADVVVPVAENTAVLAARYRALGGSIEIISKPGIGHHPHSLTDPTPIVTFILQHTSTYARIEP